MQAALEDLLDVSLQNLLAIDDGLGLNLLGRVLADIEENHMRILYHADLHLFRTTESGRGQEIGNALSLRKASRG